MSRWRVRNRSFRRLVGTLLTFGGLTTHGGLVGFSTHGGVGAGGIHTGFSTVAGMAAAEQTAPPRSRSVIVISDLHMGIGRDASGAWSPLEDFRWAADLGGFLKAINDSEGDAVDLVLNGDTFDLLQSDRNDCVAAPDLGCSEAEALARLDRVLAAHRAEMAALQTFARTGSNRVVFIPGDSDAALLWPSLQRRVLTTLGVPAARARVAESGTWWSDDRRVHAEHGHQIAFGGAHRFDGWPAPFVRRGGRAHLIRPMGERIAAMLYARLEREFAVVDNVAVLGAGIKYALAATLTGPATAPNASSNIAPATTPTVSPELIKYLLLSTVSWQQFRMELDDGDVEPPVWDLAQVRTQGGAFLVSAVPDDDPLRPAAAAAFQAGSLAAVAASLTDDELGWLCDYRAAVRRARRRFEPAVSQFAPRGPALGECPRQADTRGATFDYFWRSRDLVFGRYADAVGAQVPGPVKPAVLVLGHSHLPDRSQTNANMISGGLLTIPMEGFSPVRGALTPVVINAGAFQRTITPVQLERRLTERSLREVSMDDLPPCYAFVTVPAYTDSPAPAVRYWRQDGKGAWAIATSCGAS